MAGILVEGFFYTDKAVLVDWEVIHNRPDKSEGYFIK